MGIFELYKPLRNRIRKLSRVDALRVIWAYSQYLQITGFKMPSDIEVHRQFLEARVPQKFVSEWVLYLLAKEVLINAGAVATNGRTLRSWKVFADVLNNVRDLEGSIYELRSSDADVLYELVRIAHRQFQWQLNAPNGPACIRYYRIFDQAAINTICHDTLGLTVNDIYVCGFSLIGHFLREPAIRHPITSSMRDVPPEKVERFLTFTCRSHVELSKLLVSEQKYDDRFAYAYNSLRAFPLVRMNYGQFDSLVCPIPTLLYWRLTAGLYYELVNAKGFPGAFGRSFQAYCGEVVERACPGGRVELFAEQEYGSKQRRKDSIDWIIRDGSAAIFLECKSKRLSWNAKSSLHDITALRDDLGYMARAVVQVYKTIRDYRSGLYNHFPYNDSLKVFPVIATLENWHMFAPPMGNHLDEEVRKGFDEEGLPAAMLQEMPYSVFSIEELEAGMHVIKSVPLQSFFEGRIADAEMKRWEWMPYIRSQFRQHMPVPNLFQGEFDEIFARAK